MIEYYNHDIMHIMFVPILLVLE